MKTERNKRLAVVALAALLAIAASCWMNFRVHIAREDGAPILRTSNVSRPIRLLRSNGWPRAVWMRTNWATIEDGKCDIDEQMRPKESTLDLSGLVPNAAVFFLLLTITCLVAIAIYDRRFSLRGLLGVTVCVAVLSVLLHPYVQSEVERRRQIRELERWTIEYERSNF